MGSQDPNAGLPSSQGSLADNPTQLQQINIVHGDTPIILAKHSYPEQTRLFLLLAGLLDCFAVSGWEVEQTSLQLRTSSVFL